MFSDGFHLLTLTGLDTPLSKWNDETNSESLVDLWRKSQISRELERLLSSQETSGESKKRRIDIEAPILSDPGLKDTNSQPPYQYPQAESGTGNRQKQVLSEKTFDRKLTNDYRDSPILPNFDENVPMFMGEGFESILRPTITNTGTRVSAVDKMLDLPSETWHLIDVYFSYTHSWLPIIEKHDLLRTSYQYSQASNSNTM